MIDGSGFGISTAAMPTVISVASSRGEGGFYRHFGTTTLPTGTSEASRRGEGAFVKAKGAVLGNIKCDEEAACLQLGCRLSSLFL